MKELRKDTKITWPCMEDRILDFFFQSTSLCPVCGKEMEAEERGWGICFACLSLFEIEPACRPVEPSWLALKGEGGPAYVCYAPCFYNNFLQSLFAGYKFEKKSYLEGIFTELLSRYAASHPLLSQASWISYVPTTRRRKLLRAYDPPERMAGAVARYLGIPLVHFLKKKRSSKEQNKLSRAERVKNVEGLFQLSPLGGEETVFWAESWSDSSSSWKEGEVDSRSLPEFGLLVDDFMTSGQTLAVCLNKVSSLALQPAGLVLANVSYPRPEDREREMKRRWGRDRWAEGVQGCFL